MPCRGPGGKSRSSVSLGLVDASGGRRPWAGGKAPHRPGPGGSGDPAPSGHALAAHFPKPDEEYMIVV